MLSTSQHALPQVQALFPAAQVQQLSQTVHLRHQRLVETLIKCGCSLKVLFCSAGTGGASQSKQKCIDELALDEELLLVPLNELKPSALGAAHSAPLKHVTVSDII